MDLKIQVAVNRIIITPKAFLIAHLKGYVPKFPKNKNVVDALKFLGPIPLRSQVIQIRVAQKNRMARIKFFLSQQAVRILVTLWDRIVSIN